MRSSGRLVMLVIALIFGRGRRKQQQRDRRQEIEEAVAELEAARGPRPGEPPIPEAERKRESERIAERNQRIRRRRAEPPPTKSRSVESHPGSELVVIAALLGAALAAGGFIVFYVAYPDTQLLGLTLGLGLACFAIAAVTAGKRLVPQEKIVEEYHYY